ncbi:hypothetical protein [Catenovulum sediminis]|uniref:Uncharacterized protein n=1 Tax=Catenovulum sediminis TaxID=1740262 RepID=A0ABV1RF15_9ALTE|nr:hypothetical protein [Catenovulum sediminis]
MHVNFLPLHRQYLPLMIAGIVMALFSFTTLAKKPDDPASANQGLERAEIQRAKRVQDMLLLKSASKKCFQEGKNKHNMDREKALKFIENCRSKHLHKNIENFQLEVEEVAQINEEASENE